MYRLPSVEQGKEKKQRRRRRSNVSVGGMGCGERRLGAVWSPALCN
jgi:hypothetical protein